VRINAHIPTQQYGFIELTDLPDDPAAVEKAYNKYAEQPISLNSKPLESDTFKELTDFFGNKILYDEVNHQYSWKGEVYESGSQYASKFEKPFNKQAIAGKMAAKYNVGAQDIIDMWELSGRVSMEFGTAIHSSLELYGKHRELAVALERDSALHSHPVIRKAVQTFYEGRENEKAEYEVLIVDHKNKRAGRIDRLLINGDKDVTVTDYKTGAELKPDKLKVYWKQLEFYSGIIQANGWETRPEQIFHYNGEWKTYTNKAEA